MANEKDPIVENNFGEVSVRNHLVNTAVSFLLHPDVQKRNGENKIDFLRKKGLTNAEITAAFEKAKFTPGSDTLSVPNHLNLPFSFPPSQQPYSLWSRLSGISSSLIVFGVAIYGLLHFYQKFIKPWILGVDSESEWQKKSLQKLTDNLVTLTSTVDKLQNVVTKQNEELNKLLQIEGSGYAPTPVILEEMKREMTSLKSILISRHQFPTIPQLQQSTKTSIPAWQLASIQNQIIFPETESKDVVPEAAKPVYAYPTHVVTVAEDPNPLTNRLYFRHQTPESSFSINSLIPSVNPEATDLSTSSGNRNSSDTNFHFTPRETVGNDKVEAEALATKDTDKA